MSSSYLEVNFGFGCCDNGRKLIKKKNGILKRRKRDRATNVLSVYY